MFPDTIIMAKIHYARFPVTSS